ncbi:MAG: hypothetical protein NC337_14305 [Roseburia sp.]|nr:hypothetical protein [Roseburia sp.]
MKEKKDNDIKIVKEVDDMGTAVSDERYCSVQESVVESFKEIKLMREGKLPKKTWKDFTIDESEIYNVNIEKYKEADAKIFTDRDIGVVARKELELDKLEKDGKITILLPEDTWGVNPSFFGGMFETSIRKMGGKFRQNYIFKYSNGTELNDSLKKNIDDDFEYVIRGLN